MLCRKITLWCASLHSFHILYETVPQFNVNNMTQFNGGKGYQKITTIKNLSLKIEEVESNILQSLRKKEKCFWQIIYTNHEIHLRS